MENFFSPLVSLFSDEFTLGRDALMSLIVSLIVNLASVFLASYFTYICFYANKGIRKVLTGLIFCYSLSIVLKYIIIDPINLNKYLSASILYFLHLVPLYTTIYIFILSHFNTSLINLSKSSKTSPLILYGLIFKKLKYTIIIFINFGFTYTLFDDTKSKFGQVMFSFAQLSSRFETVWLNTHKPLWTLFLALILPVIISLLPLIIIGIWKKNEFKKLFMLNRRALFDTRILPLEPIDIALEKIRKLKFKAVLHSFTTNLPFIVYFIGVLILIAQFTPSLFSGSLAENFFESGTVGYFFKTLWRSYILAILTFLLTLLIYRIKSLRVFWSLTFLSCALLPHSIIGYGVAYFIRAIPIPIIGVDLREILSYFMAFGVFSFYFLGITDESWDKLKTALNSYFVDPLDKFNTYWRLGSVPVNLSVVVTSILVLNDSSIIGALSVDSNSAFSYAYDLTVSFKNNARTTLYNFAFIGNAFLLVIVNVIFILLAPMIYQILRRLGETSIVESTIEKILSTYKEIKGT